MSSNILDEIKASTKELVDKCDWISISQSSLPSLIDALQNTLQDPRPSKFPLNFKSIEDEVNFVALYGLVSFGSGFRNQLHEAIGRGAQETSLFLMLSIYISNETGIPDANYLTNIKEHDVQSWMNVPAIEEKPVQSLPGVFAVSSSHLMELVKKMTFVFNSTGEILKKENFSSMGEFCLRYGNTKDPSILVNALVSTFPAFHDVEQVFGVEVYLLKKAQLTAYQLSLLFPDRFGSGGLCIFADNVIPTILCLYGVIEISKELRKKLENKVLLEKEEITVLRASSVVVCELISEATKIPSPQLDQALWKLGKSTPELRNSPRFLYQDTVMF
ncbi:hypothetical protein SPOG_03503 [Schizosaccharomyces cryophilus OY26]|uniref:Queuosine 5'-phosphate N-glycosylase/hydrolase n=1 Tax=Schizosaccharomyces cryophilus (strain OY26 / ATCC MYA-4695 / CBS 11777 / NBRC 106824 / NRRL Y48691) TaxID=653667 RepID=S9VV13_SCHCR|nr:uncharacterized protein SPOG_03503 [Schizosaccharomyces cryophilus OY26]EPY50034.1 hypothetical protein SPOG_03503 [Schizosaccharomyces cryophilus OY26]